MKLPTVRKGNTPVPNKINKGFLTKTGFLRSLFTIINKQLDGMISILLTFSQCFTCVLIATTFLRVNIFLNEPIEIHKLIKLTNQSNQQVKGALLIEAAKIITTLIKAKNNLVVRGIEIKEQPKNVTFLLGKGISKVENTLLQGILRISQKSFL